MPSPQDTRQLENYFLSLGFVGSVAGVDLGSVSRNGVAVVLSLRGIGRSDAEKSAEASLVDDTSSAPVASNMSLALPVHSELSQCTERRIPPLLIRPSY